MMLLMQFIYRMTCSEYDCAQKNQYFITDGIKRQQLGPNQAPLNPVFSESKGPAAELRGPDPLRTLKFKHCGEHTIYYHILTL